MDNFTERVDNLLDQIGSHVHSIATTEAGMIHPFETSFYELLEAFRACFSLQLAASNESVNLFQNYSKVIDVLSTILVLPGNTGADVNVATLGNDLLTFTKEFLSSTVVGLSTEQHSKYLMDSLQMTLEFYKKVLDFGQTRIAWMRTLLSVFTTLYAPILRVVSLNITMQENSAVQSLAALLFYLRDQVVKILLATDNDGVSQNALKFLHLLILLYSEGSTANTSAFEEQGLLFFKTSNGIPSLGTFEVLTKEGEIIPPIEFLEISKKTKLYPYITREVIRQSCNTFKDRKENFSINLSIDDIKDTNIVNEIIGYAYK